jgi:hypothetical protein
LKKKVPAINPYSKRNYQIQIVSLKAPGGRGRLFVSFYYNNVDTYLSICDVSPYYLHLFYHPRLSITINNSHKFLFAQMTALPCHDRRRRKYSTIYLFVKPLHFASGLPSYDYIFCSIKMQYHFFLYFLF